MIAGVDTGGTFTDVVFDDGTSAKVPSQREDPAAAVAAGLGDVRPSTLAHGTTVATNALLERRGARVALITNAGFEDVIEIGRQDRPSLYDSRRDRPVPLVDRDHRFGVAGRLDAAGDEIAPLGSVPAVGDDIDVVAVCLLHSDLNAAHERSVADAVGGDVVCSHEVSPEFREFERTVTTVISAYLRPLTANYLQRLTTLAGEVLVMTSAGGLVPLALAAERPASLLLSGPAGGVRAGAAAAVAAGFPDAVTFDMGGTSTDVCLVLDGVPAPAAERVVAGFPVRVPSLDVHTIGAGGGSIAFVDAGGALVVGPESAGAAPGPTCYGRGGSRPTVTDADLVAGRIPADVGFPGIGALDAAAAQRALDAADVTAAGVIAVVDAAMAEAVRAVTINRGVDPRQLALVAFGGAGPLHACALADELDMAAVIVPARAGVLSAAGILAAPRQHDVVRSWPTPSDHSGVADALRELAAEASGDEIVTRVDCRYAGQSHELTVPSVADFPAEHRRRNGYDQPGAPIEVVALRVSGRTASPVESLPADGSASREPAVGPAVVSEPDCTMWLPEGWRADVHESGSWILRRSRS
ncbi:MAG TPA: hydantoinase/oxoprolinase family protein [Acidimicrobiales bacterium]|nr:hydantoinase/oxoprolinase family protein [Acidimicrobiales bacterium]